MIFSNNDWKFKKETKDDLFPKDDYFLQCSCCRLVMPYFAPCAEMWNTSWFVPDGSRGSSGCLRSLSVWVVMDAPLATRLRSYRISLGCMGGVAEVEIAATWATTQTVTTLEDSWAESHHFHLGGFFRRFFVGRFSAPKDTETGISNFQLTVYAECKDGTFHQIYTAAMLTSNSESMKRCCSGKPA